MKKIAIIFLLTLLQACLIGAGENSQIVANKENYFPKVSGIDLHGNKQELPQVFNNQFNLAIIAFKREQQSDVNTWINDFERLLQNEKKLSFFEIPLIYELSNFKRLWVNNGMRLGVKGDEARKRTITVYTNRAEFFKITKMQEDKIYALLLDNNGKILWQSEGLSSAEKIDAIKKIIK